jgi:hypothetical protein
MRRQRAEWEGGIRSWWQILRAIWPRSRIPKARGGEYLLLLSPYSPPPALPAGPQFGRIDNSSAWSAFPFGPASVTLSYAFRSITLANRESSR